MSDDRAILFDIADASEQVLSFIDGRVKEDLDNDRMLRAAILPELMILGEAVRQLSPEAQASFPDIDWPGYIGLRNVLIHQYRRVKLDEIWTIVDEEVRELHRKFQRFLSDEEMP